MKKRGMSGALIGTILGIIVLFILIGITIKLLPSSNSNDCTNKVYWNLFKEKLKDADNGKVSSTFFKNGDCYLVSFSSSDLSSQPSAGKIKPPLQIIEKGWPAICLCKINGQDCFVTNYWKDCYIFEKRDGINDFQMSGQYNTGDDATKNTKYIIITIELPNNNIVIKDDAPQPLPQSTSPPPITPGAPLFTPSEYPQYA